MRPGRFIQLITKLLASMFSFLYIALWRIWGWRLMVWRLHFNGLALKNATSIRHSGCLPVKHYDTLETGADKMEIGQGAVQKQWQKQWAAFF
jgi:hypothetical protein